MERMNRPQLHRFRWNAGMNSACADNDPAARNGPVARSRAELTH
jgi:hypothetical protein